MLFLAVFDVFGYLTVLTDPRSPKGGIEIHANSCFRGFENTQNEIKGPMYRVHEVTHLYQTLFWTHSFQNDTF
jgi:hypothetical protein